MVLTLYPPLIPLRPLPNFSETQIDVLRSIGEAAFHAVDPTTLPPDHRLHTAQRNLTSPGADVEPWQTSAIPTYLSSSLPESSVQRVLRYYSHASAKAQSEASLTLTLLSTSYGTAALTGFASCLVNGKAFKDLDLKTREEVLKGWSTSGVLIRRKVFRAMAAATLYAHYNTDPIALDAVGYPSPDRRELYQVLEKPKHLYDFIPAPTSSSSPSDSTNATASASGGEKPTDAVPWPMIQTEILIAGSGAGGGVVAAELSALGWECLVLDKGGYHPTGEKSRSPQQGFDELYESDGVVFVEDSSMVVLAGSVFGGGTTVNWSASLRTQDYVREEWAREKGLTHFLSEDFQRSLDAVTKRIGVSTGSIKHSKANEKLALGSKVLGAHIDAIPQNTDSKQHSCGFCSFGCPYGEKQGTPETWLIDAAKRGTKFMQRCAVEILLFVNPADDEAGSVDLSNVSPKTLDSFAYTAARSKCVGAVMQDQAGQRFVIRATKAVVVSSGSINSPAILLRSKIPNANIGKNLHLHPVSFVTGHFDEDIKPWDGSIMTYLSNSKENKDGSHYGPKLEVNMSWPGGAANLAMPWRGNAEHKAEMLGYNKSVTLIALTRDRDSGYVEIDALGRPRVHYTISKYDGESCLSGVISGAEILLSAGAKRVTTGQPSVPTYEVPEDSKGIVDPRWISWIEQVRKAGVWAGSTHMGSAHQMGTCAMSTTAATGVIDPRGHVWGTSGLYVADASAFPTPSGVNPMVTTSSVAHSIAQFIGQDLQV